MSVVVQVGRSGTRVGAPRAVADAQAEFARTHLIRLPQFFEPSLLDRFAAALDRAPWQRRIHYANNAWSSDDPAADPDDGSPAWGTDLQVCHPPVVTAFGFLLNDRALFDALQAITRCPRILSFYPNIYKILPGEGPFDDWHTDTDGTRLLALSINGGRERVEGGELQVRHRGTSAVLHALSNGTFGDALLVRVEDGLEHAVNAVTGVAPRMAAGGWFTTAPSPFPGLPA
jgi:hypothetical protein